MKESTSISAKIKAIGAILTFLMLGVIATTIYLNQQNIKDAMLINIAGKQRMLTQNISKNIFYINYTSNKDFYELNESVAIFIKNLNILKHGDKSIGLSPVITNEISLQIKEVDKLWDNFYENIQNFKLYSNNKLNKKEEIEKIVTSIYKENTILLNSVDKLVTMYTNYSEDKANFIKKFQYSSALIFILLFSYFLVVLRSIEANVEEFIECSNMLVKEKEIINMKPLEIKPESEKEIVQFSDTINQFIEKVNSAMEYSNEALLQSERASSKLEELTNEFDSIIDEFKDKSLTNKHLNNSEEIVIESTEELINSTKKLFNLKLELEKLTKSCKENQN